MSLQEGYGYVMGGLGRDWERKEIMAKGNPTLIHATSLAYQPNKETETVWVNLTIWPDNDGSNATGDAVAASTGKGTRVITRGVLKPSQWRTREGEERHGWNMSVWDIATVIRPPRHEQPAGGEQWHGQPAKPTGHAYDPDEEPF